MVYSLFPGGSIKEAVSAVDHFEKYRWFNDMMSNISIG
jgi:hypothetical protein